MYAETELAVQLCKFQHFFSDPTADNVCTSALLAPVQLHMYLTLAEVHLTIVNPHYWQVTCQAGIIVHAWLFVCSWPYLFTNPVQLLSPLCFIMCACFVLYYLN